MFCGFMKTITEYKQSRCPAFCEKCRSLRVFRFIPARGDTHLIALLRRQAIDQKEFKQRVHDHDIYHDDGRLEAWRDRNRETAGAIKDEIERICEAATRKGG